MTTKKTTKKKIPWQARQGDVLLIRAGADVATKKHAPEPREAGRVVLAHGEVTGHAHAIAEPGACLLRAEGISDRVLTVGAELALLVHEEHGTIPVEAGSTCLVRRQREWSDEQDRQVAD
jgi:hypothetical protein